MTRRAFAIGAHPDDIEFLMTGTALLLKRAGYEIHFMHVASGSCGSVEHDAETIKQVRAKEAQNSAARAGAVYHASLVDDIEIYYERKTSARLAAIVREVAPTILLVPSPMDYMEDHSNTSRLAVTAAFCRGMPNFPVSPPRGTLSGPVTIYHAQPIMNVDYLRRRVWPEIYVDISDVIDEKVALLAEHRSQKDWLDKSQGLDSYLQAMKEMCAEVGRMSGQYAYAEGWRRHHYSGLCGPDDDPLRDALESLSFVDEAYTASLEGKWPNPS